MLPFAGHTKNWDFLLGEASQGRLPPTYLFYGSPGIGKKLVATSFVRYLFCDAADKSKPCGTCGPCQKIASNRHPDFYLVRPDGKQIKIDQIRDLQKKLSRSPLEAPLKAVVVNEAHRLNNAAAHSLLKTLEEPPADALFILVSSTLFGLLPTIRSRCRRVYFSPPSPDEMTPFLSKTMEKPVAEVGALLAQTSGSAEFACQMAQEGFASVFEEMTQLLFVRKSSFGDQAKTIEKWVKGEGEVNWDLVLEVLKNRYFGMLESNRAWHLVEKIDLIEKARKDIERNVNKQLVLENLVMDLRG